MSNTSRDHDFALLPDNGPARLLRFSALPDANMLSMLDVRKNILLISPAQYGRLPEAKQRALDVTHEVTTMVHVDSLGVTFVPYVEGGIPEPKPVTRMDYYRAF